MSYEPAFFQEEYHGVTDDGVIATAARILFDDGKLDALNLLLSSVVSFEEVNEDWGHTYVNAVVRADYASIREAVLAYRHNRSDIPQEVEDIQLALNLAMPRNVSVTEVIPSTRPVQVKEDWREELLQAIRGGDVHNQAIGDFTNIHVWQGLRFRSKAEISVAEALDRAGAFYFPNCKARLGAFTKRMNREPDFLVCQDGKWGILEVDGDWTHPPTRTVHDHVRDRLFKAHGVRVVEHYDAARCRSRPDEVVGEFLRLLENA